VEDLYDPQPTPQPEVDQLGRVTATPEQVDRAIHGRRREPSFPEPSSQTAPASLVEGRKKKPSNRSKKQRHPGSQGGPGGDVYVNRPHPYSGGPRGRGR